MPRERTHASRRDFMRSLAAGVATVGLSGTSFGQPSRGGEPRSVTHLTENLLVYQGPINVGILRHGQKGLLIDCGDARVMSVLPDLGITSIEQVVFTHHHRDQACGAHLLTAKGARLGVPTSERPYFDDVSAYWKNPKSRWHIYNQHPHHLMLAESVGVHTTVKGGSHFAWGPAKISVVDTPGHTDGSVSYLIDVDGKRVCFCGDAIYDEGQVWDIHSLQKGTQTTDYHGFLGARPQLVESLKRVISTRPDTLVPSHGRIMADPPKAVDALVRRLDVCYDRYVAISALRHYFPKMFTEYTGRKDHMAIRKGKKPPACLRHFGTTWMIVSKSKAAFAMDCGNVRVVEKMKQLIADNAISGVEGLWVTHYHDDHVDAIPDFQKAFDCPCITDRSVAEVISNPLAWRIPCISPSVARVDRATKDGETWQWHEFKMTAYHLPGQTLYHSGLFVEGQGVRMLFVGDSFTMGGIDDYCANNRNWLGKGVGFDRCIALIEKLRPTHIFNCHVGDAFDFTPEQCRFMRANLADRERLFGDLVPWEHANYGMDEPWVRCYPYEQRTKPGSKVDLRVVVTNHSTQPRVATSRAVLPRDWSGGASRNVKTEWSRTTIAPKTEGNVRVSFSVPRGIASGRFVVPLDLCYGDKVLPQFSEAIVVV